MSLHLTKPSAKDEVDFMRDEVFKDRKSLAIAVEGKDDEVFWSFVFDRSVLRGKYKIYKNYNYPTLDSSGKDTLNHFLPHTQLDFAICIDSDYDYLLENPVWQRPFVFQTYTYSTENYYCYVPSLKLVLNRSAKMPLDTERVFLEDIFIRRFSTIIYEVMIESLQEAVNSINSVAARRKFGKNIRLISGQIIDTMLSDLAVHMRQKIQHLTVEDEFRQQLADKGLTSETAYLFARGKDVLNCVFMPILKIIHKEIKNETLNEIKTISDISQQKATEKAYRMSLINNVRTCLIENRDFTDCFLFQKIEKDIRLSFELS